MKPLLYVTFKKAPELGRLAVVPHPMKAKCDMCAISNTSLNKPCCSPKITGPCGSKRFMYKKAPLTTR